MGLQERLDAMKKKSIATKPPEQVAVLLESTEELVQSGIADNAIKVGEVLPEFVLPDEQGNIVNSQDFLEKGPLVVSFYRGIW